MTEKTFATGDRVRPSPEGAARNPEIAGETGRVSFVFDDGCVEVEWDQSRRVSWLSGGMVEVC